MFTREQMVLIIRHGLQISFLILTKFKRIDSFQICLILEVKFGDDSLSKFYQFKQIEGKSTTWRIK